MKTKTLKLSGNMVAIPFTAPKIESEAPAPASPSPAAPCPASHLPLVPPVGVTGQSLAASKACQCSKCGHVHELKDRHIYSFTTNCPKCGYVMYVAIETTAPVSPSLPEFTERAGFPWHATGTEIRRADNDAIASIHFATPSNRSLPSINEAEKLAKLICETLASHATLKADVERLTGEKQKLAERLGNLLGRLELAVKFNETALQLSTSDHVGLAAELLSTISLAEVGKH
jgi:predicted  nucleic acid-binding Zn-ribbon protein